MDGFFKRFFKETDGFDHGFELGRKNARIFAFSFENDRSETYGKHRAFDFRCANKDQRRRENIR